MKKTNTGIRNTLRTTLEVLVIVMVAIVGFNGLTGIFINPSVTNDFQIQIDSPLETYNFGGPCNLSQIIIFGLNGGAEHLDYSAVPGGTTVYSDRHVGMTFTIGTVGENTRYSIPAIGFYVWRLGSPGMCTVNLYGTSGGKPTGDSLASGAFDGNILTTDYAGEYVEVDMTPYYPVDPDTQYAFALNISSGVGGPAWHCVRLRERAGLSYSGGSIVTSGNGGSSWDMENAEAYFSIIEPNDYVVFNNTGFNVTSDDPITITLNYIDSDILNPSDTSDCLLNFSIGNPASATWFNLSGFNASNNYTVKVDGALLETVTATTDGVICFYDVPSFEEKYTVYWATGAPGNNIPVISDPYPVNGSTSITTNGVPINAYISDADGDSMNVSIWSNHTGSWVQITYPTGSGNAYHFMLDFDGDGDWEIDDASAFALNPFAQGSGTYGFYSNMSVTNEWGMTTDYTTYWWSVNVTDNTNWTNNTFHFTTGAPPTISDVYPADGATDVNVTGSPVSALIEQVGNDSMRTDVWTNASGSWVQVAGWDLYNVSTDDTQRFFIDANYDGDFNFQDAGVYWVNKGWQKNGTRLFNMGFTNDFVNISVTDDWGMTSGNTKYWWSINTTNTDYWTNETYSFTTGNVPAVMVETNEAFNVEEYMGYVKGTLTHDENGTGCTVWFEYGTTTSMPYTTWIQDKDEGDIFISHVGCKPGQYIYYRATANNTFITVYGDTKIFVGKPLPPTGVNTSNIKGGVNITWENPIVPYYSYINASILVYNMDHMPVSRSDGTVLYNDTNNETVDSFEHTGLIVGNTYYYSIWSLSMFEANGIYQYSDSYVSSSIVYLDNATVVTNDPSGIMETNVTLSGTLMDDGGEACTVWFEYGTTSGYGNDTRYNLSYNFINSTVSIDTAKYVNLQFSSDYWIQNNSIASDTTVEKFLNTTGIWDNITYVFRSYNGVVTSWEKGEENDLTDITHEGIYRFPILNDTVPFLLGWDNNITRTSGFSLIRDHYVRPGTLYHYRACANNSVNTTYGSDVVFLSRPKSIIRFPGGPNPWIHINGTYSPSVLNLTWIKGMGANNTYIERNTIPSWSRGVGTLVYNNTGTYYNDTELSMNTLYYYQAWGHANWTEDTITYNQYSSDYGSNSNTTQNVDPPYNGASSYDAGTLTVNLTWTTGNNSDYDVVVQNNNSYPGSPSDGWVRQNNSANSSNYFNVSITSTTYFTVWSYNETAQLYSSVGLDIPWGAMVLSCYDENHPQNGLTFNIEISNSDFTTTYAATGLTNFHTIDLMEIPYGSDTIFLVSSSDYESRTYTHDTFVNTFYNFTFYLPPALPSGGTGDPDYDENETYAEDYIIRVVGPLTEYGSDPPIGGALVTISKYINETEDYEEVFSDTTAANGEVDVPLVPGTLYHIVVTHDDYYDGDDHWTPTEIVFSDDRYRVIRLEPLSGGDIPGVDYDVFWDTITFTGVMNDIDGLNGTITVEYNDGNSSTLDTQIYIYEHYLGVKTLVATVSNISENSFSYTTGVINTTRVHSIVLYFNNSANFDVDSPISIQILNINIWTTHDPSSFEERARSIFGDMGFMYAAIISAFLAIMALVMFGPHNTGIGILASGFVLGLTNLIFTMLFTGSYNATLTLLIPVIVIIGGLYMLVKNPGGHL